MRKFPSLVLLTVVLGVVPLATPAGADHTDPRTPLSATAGVAPQFLTRGQGAWEFIRNFAPNPGTDLKFFIKRGARNEPYIYSSSGTLGQGDEQHVGQRILRLGRADNQKINIRFAADHGSAHCTTENPSGTTGLQHDAATTGRNNPRLLIDTTDATGRCHDGAGGGLELIDISGLGTVRDYEPREVHLTRHVGTSHTVTVDATRPWIVYNNNSSFAGHPWIDVLDVRTCMLSSSVSLEQKRDRCRPKVYRINFADDPDVPNTNNSEWGQMRDVHDNFQLNQASGSASCHDITARPGRIYCAGLNATIIFNVSNLTDAQGNIRGTPLPCTVIEQDGVGERTAADITDCSTDPDGNSSNGNPLAVKTPSATGWQFLGTFNHVGRDCVPHSPGTAANTSCNNNQFVNADVDNAVVHEADPIRAWNGLFVADTDERGGGVVPPGASCDPTVDNPIGNGGAHILNINNLPTMNYAEFPSGARAIYRSVPVVTAADFCDIHVIEPAPNEQRFFAAYYTQGVKIVDYHVNANGKWTFNEVASFTPTAPIPANIWVVEPFKTINNPNGTVTYFFMSSDIDRGADFFKWTGPKGPRIGAKSTSPTAAADSASVDAAMVGFGALLLPAAAFYRRLRRRSAK